MTALKNIWLTILLVSFPILFSNPTSAQNADPYLRGTLGYEWSTDATFVDRDCDSSVAAALFGCGIGVDGRSIAARGDFGSSVGIEFGAGFHALPYLRLEGIIGYRPNFAFEGQANFAATPGSQPVAGDVRQVSTMAFAYADLATALGYNSRIEPFIGFGIGHALNTIDPMYYEFPGLPADDQPAWSLTPGGTSHNVALAVAAGVGVKLNERATLEFAYRFTDYGRVETDVGPLVIGRGDREFEVEIDKTLARLRSNATTISLRWAL